MGEWFLMRQRFLKKKYDVLPGYATFKAVIELELEFAHSRGLQTVAIEPSVVIGPLGTTVYAAMSILYAKGHMTLASTYRACWVDSTELANAVFRASGPEGGSGETFCICTDQVANWFDFAVQSKSFALGKQVNASEFTQIEAFHAKSMGIAGLLYELTGINIGGAGLMPPGYGNVFLLHMRCNCSKAEDRLGVRRVSFAQSMNRQLEWLRKHNYL